MVGVDAGAAADAGPVPWPPYDAGGHTFDASAELPAAPTCVLTPELAERWIAFDSNRETYNRDIYFVHADGTELTRITTDASTEKDPAFSHSGAVLAFASDRTGTLQIHAMDLMSGAVTQLTSLPAGADQPSWSTDDAQIVFHSGPSVYVMAADGTGVRVVATGLDDFNAYKYPSLSLDGTEVVFDRNNEINAHMMTGSGQRYIVQNWTTTEETPSVSPDGVNVAYAVYCSTVEQIVVVPFAGPAPGPCVGVIATPVSAGSARRPAWGTTTVLAFERSASSPYGAFPANISISTSPGSDPCDVVGPPGDNRNPSWAPVGYELVL